MLSFCTTHRPRRRKETTNLQRPASSLEHGQLPARVSCPQLLSVCLAEPEPLSVALQVCLKASLKAAVGQLTMFM